MLGDDPTVSIKVQDLHLMIETLENLVGPDQTCPHDGVLCFCRELDTLWRLRAVRDMYMDDGKILNAVARDY